MARSPEQQVEADDESVLTALLEVLCDAVLDTEQELAGDAKRAARRPQDGDSPGRTESSLQRSPSSAHEFKRRRNNVYWSKKRSRI